MHAAVVQDYASDGEIAGWTAAQRAPDRFEVVRLARRSRWVDPWSRAAALRRLRRRIRPDLWIGTGERMLWLSQLVAGTTPWIGVLHGSEVGQASGWRVRLTRRALRSAARVVCVSEHTATLARRAGVTDRRRADALEIVPNGADAERFAPPSEEAEWELRQRLALGEGPLLVTVGHLSPRKAQDLVIRALPRLVARWPTLRYVAIGLPSGRPSLEALARELDVADHVVLPGALPGPDVATAMGTADLFVLASRATDDGDVEGYGIVVIEAALCGTPAVVSGGSGLAEAVVDGQTGRVVPPEDPAALGGAIEELLADRARRDELAAAARHRATTEATWAHRVGRYEAICLDVVARASAGEAASDVARPEAT